MPPIKLKLSLGGAARPIVLPSTPGPSRSANGASGPSTPGDSGASRPPSEGPSLRVVLPLSAVTSVTSTPASEASTPEGAPPKRKRGRPRKNPMPVPTAIPPHVAPGGVRARSPSVKLEPDDDPLAWPLSPSAEYGTPVDTSMSTPATPWREGSEDVPGSTGRRQWKRVKKPFRELANKILYEMRRKDEYGFFLEPVNVDEYPGYFETIGGADNAMDLGTMQKKVDYGEYNSIEELEADARRMHAAAHAFNLPGTAAYREADKVFKHGMKHIERSRPLVLTPTPSLSPSVPPSNLPDSERATPARKEKELKPEQLIPDAMFEFPANSLQAKAVAWNLTGGRRVRAKRLVRGREKFSGKWRDMLPDGSYDVAEMDDPADMLEPLRTRKASSWREVPDWVGMGEDEDEWWDWDGPGGPTGQPPLPGAPRLRPKPLKMKSLDLRWGRFDEIAADMRAARAAALPEGWAMPRFSEHDDVELLSAHLRPEALDSAARAARAGLPPQNFVDVNAGHPAASYLADMALGDVRGEAYAASVARFLSGIAGPARPALEAYAHDEWHGGVLQSRVSRAARDAAATLATNPAALAERTRAAHARLALRRLTTAENPLDLQPLLREPADFMHPGVGGKGGVEAALQWVGDEIARVVRERAGNVGAPPVDADGDVAMPAKEASPGGERPADDELGAPDGKRVKLEAEVAAPPGPNGAPASGSDATTEATADASTAVPAAPSAPVMPSPIPTPATAPMSVAAPAPPATPATPAAPTDGEDGLRALRLELVALSKFYPLASLKKMDAADAARLLPANVRSLMTRAPAGSAGAGPGASK